MERILHPEIINQTVRFFFQKKIAEVTLEKLIKVLNLENEQYIQRLDSKKGNYKFINIPEKTSIEITPNYISFFPKDKFDGQRVEDLREKIYKVVALKTEVYLKTAKDNYQLSLVSLLSGDLRSSANLLYYSFHKFYSSSMYSYFNVEGNLTDDMIEIEELRHFGSKLYEREKSIYNSINEVNEINYIDVLSKKINPFKLTRIIFDDSNSNYFKENLLNYAKYLTSKRWNINLEDNDMVDQINMALATLREENSDYHTDKQMLCALLEVFNNQHNASYYLLDFIGLRLYWLRQTADYDYDFEVKTSVRELCIIADCIEIILDNYNWTPRNFRSLTIKDTNKDTNKDTTPSTLINYYSAKTSFLKEINFEIEDAITYITALHLEYNFKKDLIINALNLSDYARNEGEYFAIYTETKKDNEFYVHLNSDGRWYCWLDSSFFSLDTNSFLYAEFELFFEKLVNTIKKVFGQDIEFKLKASHTDFLRIENSSKYTSLISMQEKIDAEIKEKEIEISKLIATKYNCEFKNNQLQFNTCSLNINLVLFNNQMASFVTKGFNDLFNKILFDDNNLSEEVITINLCLINESEYDYESLEGIINFLQDEFYSNFKEPFKEGNLSLCKNILINYNNFEQIIDNEILDNEIVEKISSSLNNLIYSKMKEDDYSLNYKYILETISHSSFDKNFYWATLGMWYFRNPDLPLYEVFYYGSLFYEKALDLNPEHKDLIQYNYYYELGNCCLNCGFNFAAKSFFEGSKLQLILKGKEQYEAVENLIVDIDLKLESVEEKIIGNQTTVEIE